jgi:hypothetical protein
MTTAVIYTGEMRAFDKCLPTHLFHVLRHFKNPHIFVSTVADENTHKAELLKKHFSDVYIDAVEKQPGFQFDKPWKPGQIYTHEPYAISVSPNAVLRQLWQLNEGYKLYRKSKIEADAVIRIRPDLWFHSFECNDTPAPDQCFTPWWGKFGGINDRFAIMGNSAAYYYFKTIEWVDSLTGIGCPLHPESLVSFSMEHAGVHVSRRLNTEFSTLRNNGEMRPPEISASDIARCAL